MAQTTECVLPARSPVLIVGAGLAGYSVAKELRQQAPELRICLLSADEADFYSKPSLSNAFAQGRDVGALVTATAEAMATRLGIEVRPFDAVQAIDAQAHVLHSSSGRHGYGALVLGLGATPRSLASVGCEVDAGAQSRIFSVNGLGDYRRLRAALGGVTSVVVAGAGFVGLELADDLRGAGFEVTIVDVAEQAAPRFMPRAAATYLQAAMSASGIHWNLGVRITRIRAAGTKGVRVELDDGRALEADLMVSALGLVPRIELARLAGLSTGRGVLVDEFLRCSAPDIHALGDCAEIRGELMPFVLPTLEQARSVASTLCGRPRAFVPARYPLTLKTRSLPVVIFAPPSPPYHWVEREDSDGWHLECHDAGGRLVGAVLMGAAARMRLQVQRQLEATGEAASS